MLVSATKIGFFNKLMKVGEEFDFTNLNKDKSNLGSWMEIVKKPQKSKVKKPED